MALPNHYKHVLLGEEVLLERGQPVREEGGHVRVPLLFDQESNPEEGDARLPSTRATAQDVDPVERPAEFAVLFWVDSQPDWAERTPRRRRFRDPPRFGGGKGR